MQISITGFSICSHVFSAHCSFFFLFFYHTKYFSIFSPSIIVPLISHPESLASICLLWLVRVGWTLELDWFWLLLGTLHTFITCQLLNAPVCFHASFYSFCRVPTPVAVIISAAVFALAHLTPGEFPQLFVLGSMLPFK